MKILNIGSCNIDYVYTLDHIVAPGETENTARMDVFPGGKGLNQSIAAARAGGAVYHAGCVGNDAELLTDTLRTAGVDISGVYNDCGMMIYSRDTQDTHAGGSGCGCAASVLSADLLMLKSEWED